MRIAGKTAAVDRVELEKNVVEWHLDQSQESEEQTRRWLEQALSKSEGMVDTLSKEVLRLTEMHRADTKELEIRLGIAHDEVKVTAERRDLMEAECAKSLRKLREDMSEIKYERDSLQAVLESEQGQLRLVREKLEAAVQDCDSVRLERDSLVSAKEAAHQAASDTRKAMAETVLAKQQEKVARCEQVQKDKVLMESNLRQEIGSLKRTNARLLQEKVQMAARFELAQREAAEALNSASSSTNDNTELREVIHNLEQEIGQLTEDNIRMSKELNVASDDVINLRCDLGSTRRRLESGQRAIQELKATQHAPADYRLYSAPYAYNPDTLPPYHEQPIS
eukprot:TRINITY_DN10821_c0_g1_i1.p1 TRINITY_DN10821_c0_g1~~TRINITY_DN10821_c0_g1_i1.p1  ORF type:complete len:337 (+),score=101.50 TRINITY_DN10821_c0_g1_i1:310-1320(+)